MGVFYIVFCIAAYFFFAFLFLEEIERALATRCLQLIDALLETPRVFLFTLASDLARLGAEITDNKNSS